MAFPGITEASVYGVAVPGTEGAAGMATLVADGAVDFAELRRHLSERLPAYARPLFLRIKDRIEVTATFKHKKYELAREGFDPGTRSRCRSISTIRERDAYVQLDDALFRRIEAGKIRL